MEKYQELLLISFEYLSFGYCSNTPVMYSDITGEFPILITLVVGLYIAWIVHDINQITSGNVKFIPSDDGGGQIMNSYRVQNPAVILGYSLYLKFSNKYGSYFEGSAAGIFGEWSAHNLIYNGLKIAESIRIDSILGQPISELLDRAQSSDLGHNVFKENRLVVLIPSLVFQATLSPITIPIDFFRYICKKGY